MTTVADAKDANTQKITISWGFLLLILYVYRSIFSVLGELVIMRLTPISDTRNYQNGVFEQDVLHDYWGNFSLSSVSWSEAQLSTGITAEIGGFFNSLLGGNPILINIAFQSITFIGIAYLILSLERSLRPWMFGAFFLPSFTIWTTMASKECIVVFAVCVVLGYLARSYNGIGRLGPHHLFALAVIYVFKAQYLGALGYALAVEWVCRNVRQKAFAALLIGLATLNVIYLFRDTIDRFAFLVQWSFQVGGFGRSTRGGGFFVEKYDVFYLAPEGMFRAFMGATISEIGLGPLNLLSFVESMLILSIILFFIARRFLALPLYSTVISVFTTFLILFPNYPFGVINAGTAVRYRSGWLIIVLFAVIVMLSRTHASETLKRRSAPQEKFNRAA